MLRARRLRRHTTTCAVLAVLALTSCGEQQGRTAEDPPETASSSAAGAEQAPPGTPDCAEVWQAGATIPRSYDGCADETGSLVEKDVLGCSSGQRMVRYGDRFWGVLGGTVNEAESSLDGDRDYRASMRNCSA